MSYSYLRWQVIDTPGILDHTLEERNTIEMQAITALAHLTCSVLYFMDISEQCGYSIEAQCNLFRSISPLFANKQLVIVLNKIDVQSYDTLDVEKRTLIEDLVNEQQQQQSSGGSGSDGNSNSNNVTMLQMSNLTDVGVSMVKNIACDKLLASRVDNRVATNKSDSVMNRLQVFYPTARDGIVRESYIPDSVLKERERLGAAVVVTEGGGASSKTMIKMKKKSRVGYAITKDDVHSDTDDEEEGDDTPAESDDEMIVGTATGGGGGKRKKTARELMWENGGPGVWAPDYREQYDLQNPEWRFDAIPQILDGKNIADYFDPDIEEKLRLLEEEEDALQAEYEAANMNTMVDDDDYRLDEMEEAQVAEIRDRVKIARVYKDRSGGRNRPALPREIRGRIKDCHDDDAKLKPDAIDRRLAKVGVDASAMLERGRAREREEPRAKRRASRAAAREGGDAEMEDINDDAGSSSSGGRSPSKGAMKRQKKASVESTRREASMARSHSRPRTPSQMGLKDDSMAKIAKEVEKRDQRKWFGGSGEGDHTKSVHLVKWMNTGKKRNGTHYCR